MRRVVDLTLALILVFGLVATACGSSSDDRDPTEPIATTIADGAEDARFPDDQIVWQARTTGGLVPQVAWAAQRPSLTIYGDGRFFVIAPGHNRRFDQPLQFRSGTVDRDDLAVFVAQAHASGLFEPDVSLGTPDVADMASTSVLLHGEGDPLRISAYALGGRFDTDLADDVVRSRETLRRLLSAAEALVDQPEPLTPDRIRVLQLPDDATFERKPDADPEAEPVSWPGPDPSTFTGSGPSDNGTTAVLGCTEVAGDEAGELFEAALENPLPTWDVDGQIRVIVVVALLPGEVACGSA